MHMKEWDQRARSGVHLDPQHPLPPNSTGPLPCLRKKDGVSEDQGPSFLLAALEEAARSQTALGLADFPKQ